MRCPNCESNHLKVADTRPREKRNVVMRRRQCLSCGDYFYTEERYIPGLVWRDFDQEADEPGGTGEGSAIGDG